MVVVCNIQEEEQDGVEVLVEESDALSETMKNFRYLLIGYRAFVLRLLSLCTLRL